MSNGFDVSKLVIQENGSIKEAMHVIDRNLLGLAFIVNNENKVVGVVTDGDIRRAILEGISINEKILKIMNPNPITLKVGQEPVFSEEVFKIIPAGNSLKIPILDEDNRIKDLFFLYPKEKPFTISSNLRKDHIKKVLVVGGAGYLGSILVRKLLERGYKVKILDALLYGEDGILDLKKDKNFEFVEGDMRNIHDVVDAISGVDAVIHLAALVGDPACKSTPREAIELNYFSTKLLAEICKYNQINRFLFASTCSVYGASTKEELLTEDSQLNPVSLYAEMKINSEKALLEMADSNFSPTILRMPTLFGVSPRIRFDLVINLLTAKAIVDKNITVFGGQQWRPFLHLEDAAEAYIRCLEAPVEKINGKIYNVGSEINNYKIIDIANIIKKIVPDANISIDESNPDKRNYKISFEKFKSTFNFEATKSIEYGVKEVLNLEKDTLSDYKAKKYNNFQI